jgi:protein TonB
MGKGVARTWCLAATAALALHGALWLALHFQRQAFTPERMRFGVMDVELMASPASAASPTVTDAVPHEAAPTQRMESRFREHPRQPAVAAAEAPQGSPPAAASSAAAAESPAGPVAEAYSAPVFSAAYLNNPPPPYPIVARRRGIVGMVVLRAEVSPEGHCLQARVTKSSGFGPLDEAALEAVKKWRFVPARRGGQAVSAWVEIPVNFKLEGEG